MANLELKSLKIAFIPGTGRMGSRLAGHLSNVGLSVFLGSRDPQKAAHIAQILSNASHTPVLAGSNAEAAAWGDVVVWSPSGPLAEREDMLKSLASHLENKIILDVTNILYFFGEDEWGQTSATLLNQKALGVPARWTTAFKATFWKLLEELPDESNPHHTFVAGDDEEAVATTIALVESIPGFKAVRAGSLRNSKLVEVLGPTWLIELDKLNAGGNYQSGWKFGLK